MQTEEGGVGVYGADTVAGLIGRGVENRRAIGSPGQQWLTYGALRRLAVKTRGELNAIGIGRNDRVAIVLPNGPQMATAFVSIATSATAAPLNPAYRASEFNFYFSDLNAKCLVIQAGMESPARAVAAERAIPIVELQPSEETGEFTLRAPLLPAGAPVCSGPPSADDDALVLHTSGTTSRPKIVPLRHSNVTASAFNIEGSLRLTQDDICINIMPLFHIHGLIASVLASLAAGASVSCTSGFNAFRFFPWFDEVRPTWYTAVPTMHEALLDPALRHRDIIARSRLRFVRSSSAALPARLMSSLEEVFAVPVIEAYGMTEAAHQIASNPLPPQPRYSGSVGVAAGPDIAIMTEDGGLAGLGQLGEVVIRGSNVTAGYENNPDANAKAFTHGWFRTGDLGSIDAEGYLRLTGRLKEIINRGGEKVSPLEVDGVLMDHPSVAEVVTFGIPHAKLGEDVAAAVVLVEGASPDDRSLRDFCAQRLAQFKIPRKIVFLSEIPKGVTGKLQRIGLAEKLGLSE